MNKGNDTFSIKSAGTFDDFSDDDDKVEIIEKDDIGIKEKKISLTKKKYEFKNSLKTKKSLSDQKKDSINGKSRFELLKKKLAEKKKKMIKEKEQKKENEQKRKKEQKKIPKLDLRNINIKKNRKNLIISAESEIESDSEDEFINIKRKESKTKIKSKKRLELKIDSDSDAESFQITPRNLPKKKTEKKLLNDITNKNLEKKDDKKKSPKKLQKMTTEEYETKVLKINQMDLKDMRKFVLNPPPKGKVIQVSILRDKSGFKNRFYPKFHVFFSENINYHIMSACKRPGNKSSNYILSLDKKDFKRKSKNCLGKLRSNFVGTEFHLYDQGENPKKKKIKPEQVRSEFAYIKYQKNIFGMKGPRKLRITIPKYENEEYFKFQPISKNYGLSSACKIPNNNIKCYMNNPPQWSEEHEAFVLDFYNRVEQASVKNFQLIEVGDDNQEVFLQFGKIDNNIYNLDFKYPFSLAQAVSISLSSCDNKLFCE